MVFCCNGRLQLADGLGSHEVPRTLDTPRCDGGRSVARSVALRAQIERLDCCSGVVVWCGGRGNWKSTGRYEGPSELSE